MKFGYEMLLLIFCFALVSGEIYIQDGPNNNYNVGDSIELIFSVEEDLPVNNYIRVDLECDDDNRIVFLDYRNFAVKKKHEFDISFLAIKDDKNCVVHISFLDDNEDSKVFDISSDVNVKFNLNGKVFLPGEKIVVNGSVSKQANNDFNYSLEVELGDFYSKKIRFSENEFSFEIPLDEDIASDEYDLFIYVEEMNALDEIINTGSTYDELEVLSKASSIFIDSVVELKPPYNLSMNVSLLDQSYNFMENESLIIKVMDSNSNLVYQGIVLSGEEKFFSFLSNASRGGWIINAYYSNLSSSKSIYVFENKEISVFVVNGSNSLILNNVGNIDYEGIVEIVLNGNGDNRTYPLNVSLLKNESYLYYFEQNGLYNVTVGGQKFNNVVLTGSVIFADDFVESQIFYVIGLILFLLILVLFIRFRISRGTQNINKVDKTNKFMKKEKKINAEKVEKNNRKKVLRKNKKEKRKVLRNSRRNRKEGKSLEKLKENILEPKKNLKLYGIFFRRPPTKEALALIEKYNFSINNVGSTSIALFKSFKKPEGKLLKLVCLLRDKTQNKDLLIHSVDLDTGKNTINNFPEIRSALNRFHGIIISEEIYTDISNKNIFSHIGNFRGKKLIKLYKLRK